jgi:hypothetical protein
LSVNGAVVRGRMSFPATGGWAQWKTVSLDVPLKAGTDSVTLTAVDSSGPNVDKLTVKPASSQPPPPPPPQALQAETARLRGAVG